MFMVGAAYGPTVVVPASFGALDWHWLGGVFHFGDALGALPGALARRRVRGKLPTAAAMP
jgi:hypothetical protein